MRRTEHIMGMPITIDVVGADHEAAISKAFELFSQVDARFSTYKTDSEISRINAGLPREWWSNEMKHVLELCEQTKQLTNGYFDIEHNGHLDPSGLVKGWSIKAAADLMFQHGLRHFYVEAGGDIQAHGHNHKGMPWQFGIRNPFNRHETIKVVAISDAGIATSGTYVRGQHIYNPHTHKPPNGIMSMTVIGPNIYEADRFATATFAMGRAGIGFIDQLKGFEGYMVDTDGIATMTRNFERYVV